MINKKQVKSSSKYAHIFSIGAILFFSVMLGNRSYGTELSLQDYTNDLPFEMPNFQVPEFPEHTVSITDFGAIGDAHTKNTKVFKDAIQACADAGGGQVVVPPGIWLTGAIQLQSNINLHLEKGSVILFSEHYEDFSLIESHWEGERAVRSMSPIYGDNLVNIAITGEGIIDGSGDAWRPVKKFKMTDRQWSNLMNSGGFVDEASQIWWPTKEALNGSQILFEIRKKKDITLADYKQVHSYLRPVMIGLVKCKNILLDGPTFQNSPAWNIHPLMCENIIIRNINVRNPWYSQNGDGLDLESCKNAIVYHCRFDVGDDAICMKSGRDEQGRLRGMPTENIIITDCIVYHGHGGFTIGSEMSGSIRNISVRHCTFLGTDVGLRFKSTRGRGGVVENIFIEDILMKDIPTDAIRFNMYYNNQAPIPEDGNSNTASHTEMRVPAVNEGTPRFQHIYLKNIICRGAERAIFLQGLPEMAIQYIAFENILISAKTGCVSVDADQIKFTDVKINTENSPVFTLHNSRNVQMQNLAFPQAMDVFIKLSGKQSHDIQLKETHITNMQKIQMDKDVNPDAIVIQ